MFTVTRWLSLVGLVTRLLMVRRNGAMNLIIVVVVLVPRLLQLWFLQLFISVLIGWFANVVTSESRPDILGPRIGLNWTLCLELAIVDPTPPMSTPGLLSRNRYLSGSDPSTPDAGLARLRTPVALPMTSGLGMMKAGLNSEPKCRVRLCANLRRRCRLLFMGMLPVRQTRTLVVRRTGQANSLMAVCLAFLWSDPLPNRATCLVLLKLARYLNI